MAVTITQCPEDGCEAKVAIPDNGVRLDYPAVPHDPSDPARMSIMSFGAVDMAASVPPGAELSHTLHEHQPEET